MAHPSGSDHLVADRGTLSFDHAALEVDLRVLQEARLLARDLREPMGGPDRNSVMAKLEEAAGSTRGPFMEGFSLRDAPAFDDWASLESELCGRRLALVLDRLSPACSPKVESCAGHSTRRGGGSG